MADTALATKFMPSLVPHLTGADEDLIWQQLLETLIMACTEGWAWPEILNHNVNDTNMGEFDLRTQATAGTNATVFSAQIKVNSGWGKTLPPLGQPPLAQLEKVAPEPNYYYMKDSPQIMQYWPLPEAGTAHDVVVRAMRTIDTLAEDPPGTPVDLKATLQLPLYFFTHHRDYILSGVFTRMMLMPGKPFTSNSKSEIHGRKFRSGLAKMRDYARHTWSFSPATWRFPEFAHNGAFNATWADPRISPL